MKCTQLLHFNSVFNETKSSVQVIKSIVKIKDKTYNFKYLKFKFKSQSLTIWPKFTFSGNIKFSHIWNSNPHQNQSLYLK